MHCVLDSGPGFIRWQPVMSAYLLLQQLDILAVTLGANHSRWDSTCCHHVVAAQLGPL